MDTQNSQKRSPRSSAKSRQHTTGTPETIHPPYRPPDDIDAEKHMDYSTGMVARVRAAKEAAQLEMESFGDVSEYDITILQGQRKEEPGTASQSSLDFQGDTASEQQEAD